MNSVKNLASCLKISVKNIVNILKVNPVLSIASESILKRMNEKKKSCLIGKDYKIYNIKGGTQCLII